MIRITINTSKDYLKARGIVEFFLLQNIIKVLPTSENELNKIEKRRE